MMNPNPHIPQFSSRREFLLKAGGGFGALALAALMQRDGTLHADPPQAGNPMTPRQPHMATCADDLCVVRSCHADGLNHVGSVCQMNTGSILAGRPSLGSWVTYGLGSVNQNLPGFVVLTDNPAEVAGGARNWGTGFMPATFQGTHFRAGGNPILHLNPPSQVSPQQH